MIKAFAVHPGFVTSASDGDRHYIGYNQLVELYGVDPKQCIGWDDRDPSTFRGRSEKNYIHLYPKANGDYRLDIKWGKNNDV